MKTTTLSKVFFTIFLMTISLLSYSQCNNGTPYGSGTAPTNGGSTTMSTCVYAGEYSTLSGVAASTNYESTSSIGTDYITVRQGTSGGPVIAFGQTPLSWTSTVAGNYYIHINTNASCGTASGCRTSTVTHVQSMPDNPCDAHTIVVGCSGGKLDGDNTGMTNSGISAPTCGSYAGGDLWYSLVVPASGTIKIETYEGTLSDVAMAVYSAIGGCSGTFTEIACDDNSGFGNMAELTLIGQTPGNTLYVRVWDNSNNQTGTFEIDATDLSSNYCVTGNGIDQGSGCAQLTAAANGQLGSIWDADDRFDFTSDWTFDFIVNLGNNDSGADGICFVIQNDPAGLSASGNAGGSMGAGGITNSLIIEIDTYLNTEDRNDGITGVLCSGGPDPDHLDIWLNGDVNPGSSSGCPGIGGTRYIPNAENLMNGASDYNIENGLDHTLRISYVAATQTLTATVLNLATTVTYGTVSYSPLNPMTLFGTNAPYFGFTGSTGGLNNQQSACLAPSLVLPIELLGFDAVCTNENVAISWSTASELNNDYFTIERSNDGISFEGIAFVGGAGNSNSARHYTWMDEQSLTDIAYYRLKQTDFDGAYSYSKIVVVNPCTNGGDVNLYPNPTKHQFVFDYHSFSGGDLTMEIRNCTGQLVLSNKYNGLSDGQVKQTVDISQLSGGIYFVSFSNGNQKMVRKLSVLD